MSQASSRSSPLESPVRECPQVGGVGAGARTQRERPGGNGTSPRQQMVNLPLVSVPHQPRGPASTAGAVR